MLLLTLNKAAIRLLPLRTACAIVTAMGWLVLVWIMVKSAEENSLLLRLTLVITLWSLLLVAFISLFQAVPPPPLPALKWHERLGMRLRLSLHYFMAIAFLALALSVLGITAKLILLG